MNPELQYRDGRPALRIERRLAHRPEKVWRALTEPAQLSQWYPFRVTEMDLRVGGKIRFDDGQGTLMDAVITELDPLRVFAFSVVADEAGVPGGREGENLIHLELRPESEGCLLIFTHTFDDRPAAASYATGWHGCLDALEAVVDGRPIEMAHNWVERHEAYIEAFGLNVGSAEVTPDGWRVRFERQLMQQPIDKVWATLTTSASALSTSAAHAPVVGGPAPQAFTTGEIPAGTVTAVEAPTLLEYDWQFEGRPAGRVRWELSNGPGGARIVLTQTGPNKLADLQSTALAAWQTYLERFVKQLVGRLPSSSPGTLGTLGFTQNGRPALRFERRFAHSPEKVWRAITEPEQLRAWFPAVVDFDLRPGARLRFDPTPEQKRRYGMTEDQATYGEITRVEPPNLLEYTWGEEILRWELRATDDGGCQLVFTNIFDDREMAAAAGAGWHAGLEVVEAQLDGRAVDWSPWDRAEQLKDDYVRNFG